MEPALNMHGHGAVPSPTQPYTNFFLYETAQNKSQPWGSIFFLTAAPKWVYGRHKTACLNLAWLTPMAKSTVVVWIWHLCDRSSERIGPLENSNGVSVGSSKASACTRMDAQAAVPILEHEEPAGPGKDRSLEMTTLRAHNGHCN